MSLKVPLELLDIIIGHITETSDLLSFGLTCKFVADIIFPYHLHYHTISAPIRKSHLWTFLSLNPRLCRYIRRLEVIDFHNPKMRLSDTEYEETKDVHPVPTDSSSAVLWSYEAFFRALREMINLKVFKWLHNETPILHSEGSIAKELPNLNFRGRMSGSPFSFRDIVPGHYASIFDTSVLYRTCNLVSVTLNSSRDFLDCGGSISNVLGMCHELKYLNLFVNHQALVSSLITSCRWPKLQVLSLSLSYDRSKSLTDESIRDFFEFHGKIVSLKWRVSSRHFTMPTLSFPPGLLPCLKALEGDKDLVRSIITTPCIPPRPLKKILNFPTSLELWKEPEKTFQGIDRFKLQIVSFMVRSLSQMTDFGRFFTNVDCIDISESNISTGIWDDDMKHFRTPLIVECVEKLSCFRNLRVILGIQFLDETLDEDENDRRLSWIVELFPCLEFCADRFSSIGINLIRDDHNDSVRWEATSTLSWGRFIGRDADFMIPEESDSDVV